MTGAAAAGVATADCGADMASVVAAVESRLGAAAAAAEANGRDISQKLGSDEANATRTHAHHRANRVSSLLLLRPSPSVFSCSYVQRLVWLISGP